jgi:hypothetical protein
MRNYCEETEQCRRQFFYEKFTENQLKFFEKCGKMCDHCRRLKGLDLNDKYTNRLNTNTGNNEQKTGNRYGAQTTTSSNTPAVFDITGNDDDNDGWIQRRAPTLPSSSLSNENKPRAAFVSARTLHQSSSIISTASTNNNNNLLEKKRQLPGSLSTTTTLGKPIRQATILMVSRNNNININNSIQPKVEKEVSGGGGGKFSTASGKTVLSHFMSSNPLNNNKSSHNNSSHDGFQQKNSYNNAIELDQEEDDWILPVAKKVKREYSL